MSYNEQCLARVSFSKTKTKTVTKKVTKTNWKQSHMVSCKVLPELVFHIPAFLTLQLSWFCDKTTFRWMYTKDFGSRVKSFKSKTHLIQTSVLYYTCTILHWPRRLFLLKILGYILLHNLYFSSCRVKLEGDLEVFESNSTGLHLIEANIERENKEQVNFRFVQFLKFLVSFFSPEI